MNVAEAFLTELQQVRATGANVPETSFYPALSNLFNSVGNTLAPKVRCVMNLANRGAGIPDGGLFTAEQFQRQADSVPPTGALPSRGALEVKAPRDSADTIAASEQVARYLQTYGIVLVTNLREFLIVERTSAGPAIRERFTLADNERDFWQRIVAHPRAFQQARGDEFGEFIQRACLHAAPLSSPKDVAWFMASYARVALQRVERRSELPALKTVREGLEEALGMKFADAKGEHFFRSTLVQTVFYGVFSAWVLWHKQNPGPGTFDWRTAGWTLHVPFIRTLYDQLATRERLGSLDLVEVLNWTAAVLNRVRRAEFFGNFAEDHAVQYFYEPFLAAFDPELRKELGVWYTPREIVKYQVARVDTVLREELGIADGLADPNVIVLDPCCGTGAYLVEVLDRIAETLRARGDDALLANDLKRAAMDRVFGFELLPAPFVVSHLQLGLLLEKSGAPLSHDSNERVGVYLTNALTGWKPPEGPRTQIAFPELAQERDAAESVKQEKPIIVILGNPPYDGLASVAVGEERELSDAYRTTQAGPQPEGQGLNELYVRFWRMAERRIVESGRGIVCFITNYSWLDGRSHPAMRERFLEAFDTIRIDCLNGDKYKTGKKTPDGRPDPSVFSTKANREGIRVGTAIATLVRREGRANPATVSFRHFWGARKLDELRDQASALSDDQYEQIVPRPVTGYPMIPQSDSAEYFHWPKLTELFPTSFPGIKTSRDPLVVDIDRPELERRMASYFDPDISDEEMAAICPAALRKAARFSAKQTREYLIRRGIAPEGYRRYQYRPFDLRWLYWERETKLLDEKRLEYVSNWTAGGLWLAAVQHNRKDFDPPIVSTHLCSLHVIERGASLFPLELSTPMRFEGEGAQYNLTEFAAEYLVALGAAHSTPRNLFLHTVAVMYAPQYRIENAGPLRLDWPRVPLPREGGLLEASAALGEQVSRLLDTESDVSGVTSGTVDHLFRVTGNLQRRDGGQVNTSGEDLSVALNWGYFDNRGAVMPGDGKTQTRERDSAEREALAAQAGLAGLTLEKARALLGESTLDVYLNGEVFWRNVPEAVWNFHIGGYQVVKKWLSYREKKVLGRNLKPEEAREVTNMIRRLTALVLMGPQLDANYHACAAAPQFTIAGPGQPAATTEEE